MNKYLLITTTILCFYSSFGQEVQVSQDTVSNKKSEKYKYQSIDQYDQKLLFKLGSLGGATVLDFRQFQFPADLFAVEYKLTNALSIEGTYYFPRHDFSALSGKARYYFKKGQQANNLSGNYLAFEYVSVRSAFGSDLYLGSDNTYFIQFGNQIKESRFGYADFSIFSSYQQNKLGSAFFIVGVNFTLGASWGPLGTRNVNLQMDEFNSNKIESWLFTLDNPFLIISNRFNSFVFSVSTERELFLKGLTAKVQLSYGFSKQLGHSGFVRFSKFDVSGELRKYVGTIGKRGFENVQQPFSGLYAGVGVGSLYVNQNLNIDFSDSELERLNFQGNELHVPYVGIGYQERFGKRYFFDFFTHYQFSPISNLIEKTRGPNVWSVGTRVGFTLGR